MIEHNMNRNWRLLVMSFGTIFISAFLNGNTLGFTVQAQNYYSDNINSQGFGIQNTGEVPVMERFKAQKQFSDGYKAYSNRQFRSAISYFNECIRLDPRHAQAYRFRGEAFMGLEDYRSALNDFNNAVISDPNDPQVYNFKGICYYMLGQYSQALKDFETALAIDPSFGDAADNRLLVLEQGGQPGFSTFNENPNQFNNNYSDGRVSPSFPQSFRPSTSLGPANNIPGTSFNNFNTSDMSIMSENGMSDMVSSDDPFGGNPFPEEISNENDEEEAGESYPYPEVLKQTTSDVFISEVRLAPSGTYVTLTIKPKQRFSFEFDRPDNAFDAKNAIVAADQNFLRTYRLVRLDSIRWNQRIVLSPGESATVTLQFEPLPLNTKIFHIRQGNNPLRKTKKPWNFYEIKLEDEEEGEEGQP